MTKQTEAESLRLHGVSAGSTPGFSRYCVMGTETRATFAA